MIQGDVEEIAQKFRPFHSQETFRMKLDAVQRPGSMSYTHDLAFRRPGRDREIGVAKSFAPNDEAMVARRLEWIGQPAKNPLVVVMDG